eukprot:554950-Pelagomonas_calceolata.AAC.1
MVQSAPGEITKSGVFTSPPFVFAKAEEPLAGFPALCPLELTQRTWQSMVPILRGHPGAAL